MKIKYLITLFFLIISFAHAQKEDSSSLTKQKIEIRDLKKELNTFYNKKEKEYQERKKELELIVTQLENEKKAIQRIRDENKKILDEVEQTVQSKTAKIYNSMKPKTAAKIFDEMIEEGSFDDVFDIILKLKEKKVTLLMKALSVQNAARITQRLENYSLEDK